MSQDNIKFKMNYDVNCPAELLANESITDVELRVYLVIRAFTKGKDKSCWLTNEQISQCCGKKPTLDKNNKPQYGAIKKAIFNLKDKKLIYVDTRQNRTPKRKIYIGKQAFERQHGLSDDNSPIPDKFNNVSHFRNCVKDRATGYTLIMRFGENTTHLMVANNGIVNKETYKLIDNENAKKCWEFIYQNKQEEIKNYIKIKEQK